MRADTSACDKAVAAVESIQGATKNANQAMVASMRSMSHAIGGTLGAEITATGTVPAPLSVARTHLPDGQGAEDGQGRHADPERREVVERVTVGERVAE